MNENRDSGCLNEDQLVADCPQCGYSLRGLPAGERPCPECGRTIDRAWHVFGGEEHPAGRTFRLMMLFGLVAGPVLVLGIGIAGNVLQAMAFALILGLVALPLMLPFWRKITWFVAVGADGVRVIHGSSTAHHIQWDKLISVQLDSSRSQLILHGHELAFCIPIYSVFQFNTGRIDVCVELIQAGIAKHESRDKGLFRACAITSTNLVCASPGTP